MNKFNNFYKSKTGKTIVSLGFGNGVKIQDPEKPAKCTNCNMLQAGDQLKEVLHIAFLSTCNFTCCDFAYV